MRISVHTGVHTDTRAKYHTAQTPITIRLALTRSHDRQVVPDGTGDGAAQVVPDGIGEGVGAAHARKHIPIRQYPGGGSGACVNDKCSQELDY